MYGICHKGVEVYVVEAFGQESWERAKKKARIDGEVHLDAYYEDSMSTRVFDAIIEEYPEKTMDRLLYEFGEFWVRYARDTSLKALLADATNLTEMLDSLNDMHARMKLLLPQMRPPVFEVDVQSETLINLHYHSERDGLAPMVIGLINELGRVFEVETDVVQTAFKNDEGGHDIFAITMEPIARQQIAAE